MKKSDELGRLSINKLLVQQSVPAAIGILVMSIYMIADTIFVGQWVGPLAIGAITVVMPITFLIASIGMAIGVGGGSIIARSLGKGDEEQAQLTFGNQIVLVMGLILFIVAGGLIFDEELLILFGGRGDILPIALEYYHIVLIGVPFLGWAMMSNNTIRAQGFPRVAMNVMLLPAILNLILDPIFIKVLDMGMAGAAWATTISYIVCAFYTLWFFVFGKSELKIRAKYLRLRAKIIKEISNLGLVTLARQGTVSILTIVVNQTLFYYGGDELYISVYGIISRIMMFALFPIIGLTQGTLPIVGFNYGAELYPRVREALFKSIAYGTAIAGVIFIGILLLQVPLVRLFTDDPELLKITPPAVAIVFLAIPIVCMQLIGAAYFQAVGKALPALLLTLSRQGLFLIPLLFIMPYYFGVYGVWYSFPLADVLATLFTLVFLRREWKGILEKEEEMKNKVNMSS